jgi:hypothetical protein
VGVTPQIIHFVWISSPDYGVPAFGFSEWVAVRSAKKANPGYRVVVWTDHSPVGKYWKAIKSQVEIKKTTPPKEVCGNKVSHPAHKTDWLRLTILSEFGGVYLDIDTITLKSFDPIIRTNRMTMVREVVQGRFVGLCNAFIASPPRSKFIELWKSLFVEFASKGRDKLWNQSGVQWPAQVASDNPGLCDTLHESAYFVPDWSDDGIAAMWDRQEEYPNAIGHHLWSAIASDRIKQIDETNMAKRPCTYTNLVQGFLNDEIRSELVQAQNT